MKFKEFEDNGLKIDNERVLTYSKLSCPLECTYCFVDEMTQEQSREAAYLTEKQFGLLENLPEQVKLIMLGCDTEFFQNKQQALDILERLSDLGKDISEDKTTATPLRQNLKKRPKTIGVTHISV